MKTIAKLILLCLWVLPFTHCAIPFNTAAVPVPNTDSTPPVLTNATFTVLGPGGQIYNLNDIDEVGVINIEQVLKLNFVAQDRESGIQSIEVAGPFLFWCGSVGFGEELSWPINVTNYTPVAAVGESVRVTAGASKNFKISDAYEATTCPNPPPRYQDLRGTFTVTATNHKGLVTTRTYSLTLTPSPTGVTVLVSN